MLHLFKDFIEKVPSYTGKARFADRIKKIQTKAFVLADNLRIDAAEIED